MSARTEKQLTALGLLAWGEFDTVNHRAAATINNWLPKSARDPIDGDDLGSALVGSGTMLVDAEALTDLVGLLVRYGDHLEDCPRRSPGRCLCECDCGWSDVLDPLLPTIDEVAGILSVTPHEEGAEQ